MRSKYKDRVFDELLENAKYALKCLEAANDAMGGWNGGEYYIVARRDLRSVIRKAEKLKTPAVDEHTPGSNKKELSK